MALRMIRLYSGEKADTDILGASAWLPEIITGLENNPFLSRRGHKTRIVSPTCTTTRSLEGIPAILDSAYLQLEIAPSMDAATVYALARFICTEGLAVLNTNPFPDTALFHDMRTGEKRLVARWDAQPDQAPMIPYPLVDPT